MSQPFDQEEERLQALSEFERIHTTPEPAYDRLVALASKAFHVPIALMTLADRRRLYLKAKVGLEDSEAPHANSFCTEVIASKSPLIILDAATPPCFAQPPCARFYAGMPLISRSGHAFGSLCVMDFDARPSVEPSQVEMLRDIAQLIEQQIELSRHKLVELRADASKKSLAAAERNFRLLVESITDYAIYMIDRDGVVTNWNVGAQRLKGYSSQEIVGRRFDCFYTEEDRVAGLPDRALAISANEGRFETEGWRVRKDGSRFWADVVLDPIRDENGILIGFAKITRDVSDRKRQEEKLHRLAHFDTLTDLPNRLSLTNLLESNLNSISGLAVLMMDLDGFKHVNDTLGHSAGDRIIKAAAERIRACIPDIWSVARFGGDEFAAIVPNSIKTEEVKEICNRLVATFHAPFLFDHEEIYLGLTIGVAFAPDHGKSAEELFKNADLALYKAKDEGRRSYRIFQAELKEAAIAKRRCERELHQALARNEFVLFYQPQVDLSTGRIVGAEALLRWNHPQRGLLTPAAFIDILERSSLAAPVGDWIIDTACAHAANVRRLCNPDFVVGVNLFPVQFQKKKHLTINVLRALGDHDLPPSALELEITETTIVRRKDHVLEQLRELRSLGVGIAFDDFGTGYASLSLLKGFPLTRLKIDQSFVRDLSGNGEDAAIVKAILSLAEGFGLETIAEGVETLEQEAELRSLGCKQAQGYLFSRPVPAETFLKIISEHQDMPRPAQPSNEALAG